MESVGLGCWDTFKCAGCDEYMDYAEGISYLSVQHMVCTGDCFAPFCLSCQDKMSSTKHQTSNCPCIDMCSTCVANKMNPKKDSLIGNIIPLQNGAYQCSNIEVEFTEKNIKQIFRIAHMSLKQLQYGLHQKKLALRKEEECVMNVIKKTSVNVNRQE